MMRVMRPGSGVRAYVGLWGSGKTLALAAECAALRDQGVQIATNFGFCGENYSILTFDDWIRLIGDLMGERRRVHFAIDEMAMLLAAREYSRFPPALNVVFFQGRKFGLSLSYTAQHFDLVDANVRRITSVICNCRGHGRKRISLPGNPREYRPLIFSRSYYAAEGYGKRGSDRLGFQMSSFDQSTADLYDTYALIASAQASLSAQVAELSRGLGSRVLLDRSTS
jgi:hypothetical protein